MTIAWVVDAAVGGIWLLSQLSQFLSGPCVPDPSIRFQGPFHMPHRTRVEEEVDWSQEGF